MITFVEQHRSALEALCRKYHVARLDLFGSAADGNFDLHSSDLDFLVEFQPNAPMGPFHQYFDFLAELEQLFGCPVDLIESRAMKNPYFIKAVNASRKPLYAA
ncbi:MAG: nucleotidyltransferase family protein [Planctomycetota bacterium]